MNEPVGHCVARQWAKCHPASCSKDSSEEVSHPSVMEAADTHCGSNWPASGEVFRRMEHLARADTQVTVQKTILPPRQMSTALSFPEEFHLTRGDDEIENHAPTGERQFREMECPKLMQVSFHQCI